MEECYILKISDNELNSFDSIESYTCSYSDYKKSIEDTIEKFKLDHDYLDAKKMQGDWFPNIDADVFISHSHKDEELAKKVAGYIFSKFNKKVFIDSIVWKKSTDLLKLIDEKYCINSDNKTYNYNLRNDSTSHVYMMLSVALSQMIEKCKYFIFLETENSDTKIIENEKINKTNSPWIYHEIMTTRLLYKQESNKKSLKNYSEKNDSKLKMAYEYSKEHLTEINLKKLNEIFNK